MPIKHIIKFIDQVLTEIDSDGDIVIVVLNNSWSQSLLRIRMQLQMLTSVTIVINQLESELTIAIALFVTFSGETAQDDPKLIQIRKWFHSLNRILTLLEAEPEFTAPITKMLSDLHVL